MTEQYVLGHTHSINRGRKKRTRETKVNMTQCRHSTIQRIMDTKSQSRFGRRMARPRRVDTGTWVSDSSSSCGTLVDCSGISSATGVSVYSSSRGPPSFSGRQSKSERTWNNRICATCTLKRRQVRLERFATGFRLFGFSTRKLRQLSFRPSKSSPFVGRLPLSHRSCLPRLIRGIYDFPLLTRSLVGFMHLRAERAEEDRFTNLSLRFGGRRTGTKRERPGRATFPLNALVHCDVGGALSTVTAPKKSNGDSRHWSFDGSPAIVDISCFCPRNGRHSVCEGQPNEGARSFAPALPADVCRASAGVLRTIFTPVTTFFPGWWGPSRATSIASFCTWATNRPAAAQITISHFAIHSAPSIRS